MNKSIKKLKVFLCYAHGDRDTVTELFNNLTEDGVDAWMDSERLLPGQDWELEIRKIVRQADVVVVCLSNKFNRAGFRQKELRLALETVMEQPEGEIFIIPARLEVCETLESLKKWHWVDLFDKNGYGLLMDSLQARLRSVERSQQLKLANKLEISPNDSIVKNYDEWVEPSTPKRYSPETIQVGEIYKDVIKLSQNELKELVNTPRRAKNRKELIRTVFASNLLMGFGKPKLVDQYWKQPYGEPRWVVVPAGEFWMGNESGKKHERPVHRSLLPNYKISQVPITNRQYELFIKDTNVAPPNHWQNGEIPIELGNHPVVCVSWYDAIKYCKWLGKKIRKHVNLPSEKEWEKAARGNHDQREYPWGGWKKLHCNSSEIRFGGTMPVGIFLNGASPYGILDMSGNVWEWTRTIWGNNSKEPNYLYPYKDEKKQESFMAPKTDKRILRGGSFSSNNKDVRCTVRYSGFPNFRDYYFVGFRVVIS